jgi:hypothetical protein
VKSAVDGSSLGVPSGAPGMNSSQCHAVGYILDTENSYVSL